MRDDVWGPLIAFGASMLVIVLISSAKGVNIGFRFWGLPPLGRENRNTLKKYSDFYNALSIDDQLLFEKRIRYFMKVKDFIPRNIPHVTAEMKTLISATAIQITFGYPKIYLSHFKRILVYPDNYYSTINKVYHQGEVNPLNQVIVLSWTNFVNGIINNTSGINLGLHEMAHALRLENMIRNNEYDFLDRKALNAWENMVNLEIDKINRGEESIFRSYGATCKEEFFAVAIENFFERPELFKNYNEELFITLKNLLKQ